MKHIKILFLLLVALIVFAVNLSAKENIGQPELKQRQIEAILSGCSPGATQTSLDINNVRTTLLTDGDMWWNLVSAHYEIPKGGGAHSIFAGALWIGGLDVGGQLKVAAMTYRQSGIDFWPGPLDKNNISNVKASTCQAYDKHYPMTKTEVQDWVNTGKISSNIINWPGTQDPTHPLAPFVDVDGNGIYNPKAYGNSPGGDYPKYSLPSKQFGCNEYQIFGDKTFWWVYNDMGNIHTETKGNQIGLEIHAQAFAYTTNDALNNCTFYDYQVINYSTVQLNKCYFGQWIDMDIGYPFDDYVGCDVTNGVGYTYNGLSVDGTGSLGQYGANPPACGCDFFRGPYADPTNPRDGVDSNGVSFVDQFGRIGMAKFVYYNNDFTPQGNPVRANDYYNYLRGFWIDGTAFTYGGNAYHGAGQICDFMFPGTSDPTGLGTGHKPQQPWSEVTANDQPGDRRFMQSAGPFTLKPGAVNSVTVGIVWGRATQGGNTASIPVMLDADVEAQALFNNCFKIMNGPDAPDLTVQEMPNGLILYLTNKPSSNNYKEAYREKDAYMTVNKVDTAYTFQGYQVFQLADSSVTEADLNNTAKARQIFQCDIQDGVSQIINYYKDASLGGAWVPTQMVFGKDSGITHSFMVTHDQFATGVGTGNTKLINNKQYYFMAIAYGYNKGETNGDPSNRPDGFNLPYMPSRRNVHYTVAVPHSILIENGGTVLNASYGTSVNLTRVEGQGNGGQILELTSKTVTNILNTGTYSTSNPNGARVTNITYEPNHAPLTITVIDPLLVPTAPDTAYRIAVTDTTGNARWILTNVRTGAQIKSDTVLKVSKEQIIPSLGISIKGAYVSENISMVPNSNNFSTNGGVLDASLTFSDPTKAWLYGLPDQDLTTGAYANINWIRSGKSHITTTTDPAYPYNPVGSYSSQTGFSPWDGNGFFQKILGGTWAPFSMCAYTDANYACKGGPARVELTVSNLYSNTGNALSSVDVVFTSDKTKWTRCPVLEEQEYTAFAQGGAKKLNLRRSPSIDQQGYFYGDPRCNTSQAVITPANGSPITTGMGWFPGYVIDVETGERLNMAYGEDSGLPLENGRDMQWNPTSNVFDANASPIFGGKHYIYIFAHTSDQTQAINTTSLTLANGPASTPRYDGGVALWQLLKAGEGTFTVADFANNVGDAGTKFTQQAFADAMWVNIPLLSQGHTLLESDAKVRIRWPKKFRKAFAGIYGASIKPVSAPIDTLKVPSNKNYPLYAFSTKDIAPSKGVGSLLKGALDLINIVPNPYYAYSAYETGQLDNRVRITNLPATCTIRIYTLNGALVRTFNKSDANGYLDWNLQNHANVPIASGMYIIHINVPGVGEKILKWFGVIRPQDLNSF